MLDFARSRAGRSISGGVLTFSDATQQVTGTLQDQSGRPAPDYTIIVFAADKRFWVPQARRIRTTRPGTDGRFTVTNLPVGECGWRLSWTSPPATPTIRRSSSS